MKQPKSGGCSARIQTLIRLRLVLSVVALILCGSIVFCAVSLGTRVENQATEEAAQTSAEIETIQTLPPAIPSETMPGEATIPQTRSDEDLAGTEPEITHRQDNPDGERKEETTAPEPGNPSYGAEPSGQDEQAQATATEPSAAAALPAETVLPPAEQEGAVKSHVPALTILVVSAILLASDLAGIAVCTAQIRKLRWQEGKHAPGEETVDSIAPTVSSGGKRRAAAPAIRVGQLHNIGARPCQEDSSGVANLDNGVFAVVADGMGGLSGGDRVSQKIVYTMLEYSSALRPGQMDGALEQMLSGVNDVINQMLGTAGLQKSGSTLIAVLVRDDRFHWITVGDSHIYLYHEGSLVQLNQEHNRGQELLRQAIAGQLTFDEVRADPRKSGLTSYIGMGRLKYVDKSLHSIPLTAGDRILLMTDGVFNALPEETICAVLKQTPDVAEAAQLLERAVINRACPHQDNFTAVILGFDCL